MSSPHLAGRSGREREPVTVNVDPGLLAEARSLGISLSAALAEALRVRISEARQAEWLEENASAIAAYNDRIARAGVWSDALRLA